jgi:hypothetical protein
MDFKGAELPWKRVWRVDSNGFFTENLFGTGMN